MLHFIIVIILFIQVIRTQDASVMILDETREIAVNHQNSNFYFPIWEEIGQPAGIEISNNTLSNINNFTTIGIDGPSQNSNTSSGGVSDKDFGNTFINDIAGITRVIGNDTRSPAILDNNDVPIPAVIGDDDRSPSVLGETSLSLAVNISPQDSTSPNPSPDFTPFTPPPPMQGSVFGPSSQQDSVFGNQNNDNFNENQIQSNEYKIIPEVKQFNITEIEGQPYISNVLFESKLGAILPRQITPSKDDVNACRTFWTQQPQGYNGNQITHCYPLSAVGRLQIFFEGISEPATCTGSVIGAHTVLTAAHCFLRETTNIEFTPGQFGDYKPFGSFQNGVVYKSEKFDWADGSNDYAVVNFSEDIGELTGWLGMEYGGCDNARGYDLMVAGFAEDRESDQMWTAECADTFVDACANGDESGTFRHECDTNGGTSGAPLMEKNLIVGVHSGYINAVDKNTATYISRELMDFIDTHIS